MPLVERHIGPRILQSLHASPVVLLNGARQTGKSTLVQMLKDSMGTENRPASYFTFDKPNVIASATSAPESFLGSTQGPMIIDEVQMVPDIFRSLKIIVDEKRLKDKSTANGQYLLTGSANILALPRLSDALVGRMSVLTLYPFSTAEALHAKGNGLERMWQLDFTGMPPSQVSIIEAIRLATFPEISGALAMDRNNWFDGYITTLLQRDIRIFADLEKAMLLPQLLRILAVRAGGLINDSDIARELGLNSVTGKSYRNILKMMFLNLDVEPWYRNIGKRLVKAPKGYLLDTLMLCYLLGVDIEHLPVNRPELFGHLVENYVATEIVKLLSVTTTKATLHHFRTSDHKEIDFILERQDGSMLALEVKSGEQVSAHDFKGIRAFSALAGRDFAGGIVLYTGKEVLPFGDNCWAVPLSVLWQ